jgi:N-dimethylarginine dimethylaminohydrolase
MKISSHNEWSPLKSVVVGTAQNANWPTQGSFREIEEQTLWKETPVPSGPVEDFVIREAQEGLDNLTSILSDLDIDVYRPVDIDYQIRDAMSAYNPRDRLLIVGETVINCNMQYDVRNQEIESYPFVIENAKTVLTVPDNIYFDAANVCRLNDTLLYLVSPSGSAEGAIWLQEQFTDYKVETTSVYGGVHIDSTFTPIREGLVVVNKDRVSLETCPQCFSNWDKIWLGKEDLPDKYFYNYPYASNYILLNFLMVDEQTAIIDGDIPALEQELAKYSVEVIKTELKHSRTLGGGHHCTTLDLHRS